MNKLFVGKDGSMAIDVYEDPLSIVLMTARFQVSAGSFLDAAISRAVKHIDYLEGEVERLQYEAKEER